MQAGTLLTLERSEGWCWQPNLIVYTRCAIKRFAIQNLGNVQHHEVQAMDRLSILIRDIREFERVIEKALGSHRKREARFLEAERHRQNILGQLDDAALHEQLDQLLSKLNTALTMDALEVTKHEINHHRQEFAEKESSFDQIARLSVSDYLECIQSAQPYLRTERFQTYAEAVPKNAAGFRAFFEEVSATALERARESSALPRK